MGINELIMDPKVPPKANEFIPKNINDFLFKRYHLQIVFLISKSWITALKLIKMD
jgi:hypothetical protein